MSLIYAVAMFGHLGSIANETALPLIKLNSNCFLPTNEPIIGLVTLSLLLISTHFNSFNGKFSGIAIQQQIHM